MKRILCLLLGSTPAIAQYLPAGPVFPTASGGPAIAGTPVGIATSGSGTTVNYSPSAGNALIVAIGCESYYCQTTNPPSVTLTGSSTANLTQDSIVGWAYASSYFYRYQSVPAGITGVTISWPFSDTYTMVVIEVSGLASSPVDVVDATGNTGTSSTWTTGTMSGVTSGDLVLGMLHSSASSSAPTVATPWSGASFGNASYMEAIYSYRMVSSDGSYTPAATGQAVTWYSAGITYK